TQTFRIPVSVSELSESRTIHQENQFIQYYDGLGRLIQKVDLKASPDFKDLVTFNEYDVFGRQIFGFLSYSESSSADGSFKSNAKTQQLNFYGSSSWDGHIKKTSSPFAKQILESSPLNRLLEQGAPGSVWQPGTSRSSMGGRTVVTEYGSNGSPGDQPV